MTAGAADGARRALTRLEVNPERMRANLALGPAELDPTDLGSAEELVDKALGVYEGEMQ
jgi:hypothetical protein